MGDGTAKPPAEGPVVWVSFLHQPSPRPAVILVPTQLGIIWAASSFDLALSSSKSPRGVGKEGAARAGPLGPRHQSAGSR